MSWTGAPLDPALRDLLEALFEADLGGVRLHRGRGGRLLAGLHRATGVTFGRRLFFSAAGAALLGRLDPAAVELAAHEVAHALQYRRHGLFGMLGRYLADYLRGRRAGRGHHGAYLDIGFEREARRFGEAARVLVAADAAALRALGEGTRPPAGCLRRAAEAGRRLRCAPPPGPAPRAG